MVRSRLWSSEAHPSDRRWPVGRSTARWTHCDLTSSKARHCESWQILASYYSSDLFLSWFRCDICQNWHHRQSVQPVDILQSGRRPGWQMEPSRSPGCLPRPWRGERHGSIIDKRIILRCALQKLRTRWRRRRQHGRTSVLYLPGDRWAWATTVNDCIQIQVSKLVFFSMGVVYRIAWSLALRRTENTCHMLDTSTTSAASSTVVDGGGAWWMRVSQTVVDGGGGCDNI